MRERLQTDSRYLETVPVAAFPDSGACCAGTGTAEAHSSNAAYFVGLTHDFGLFGHGVSAVGILELGCDSAESVTTRIIDRVDSLRAEAEGMVLV